MWIFLVYKGGGSDAPVMSIWRTEDAAIASCGPKDYVVAYRLNQPTDEFEERHTICPPHPPAPATTPAAPN